MDTLYLTEANLNPTGENKSHPLYTAVNAVAIATETPWQEVVKKLIEQAHIRSNIPAYSICITDMIRASGFKKADASLSVKDFFEKSDHLKAKSKYIIKLNYAGYFAMIPDESGEYVVKGILRRNANRYIHFIDEVWEWYPGTDNRTGILRTHSERSMPDEHKRFTAKNLNPQNKYVGDCVIRALSASYNDCSWDEAMDHLAKASNYCEPFINSSTNISLTLSKLGFEYHKRIYRNNRLLTGKEFCELMSHTYFKGEKIFAFVGSGHCAAVLPIKQSDGTYIYKIQDTWDSTSKKICDYWTYREKKSAYDSRLIADGLKLNKRIIHPKYGEGTIIKINSSATGNIMEIDFNEYGIKKISEDWIQKNKTS